MQAIFPSNNNDFDSKDIPKSLMFLYFKLNALEKTTQELERTVAKMGDIVKPLVDEKQVELQIKKDKAEQRDKRLSKLQAASIIIGLILTAITVVKIVDGIYLDHQIESRTLLIEPPL